MSAGIVKYKTDTGQDMQLTSKEVVDMVCPNATPHEVELFLRYCEAHRLDPIGAKDAYLIKYGSAKASMVTGYQVFNRRAKSFPDYRGIESGVVIMRDGQIAHKQGNAVYKAAGERLIGGWAKVYVDGWTVPTYCEVDLDSYSTGKSNWAKMPGVMIEKVAKSAAWRTAYPDEFSGMYTSEEMDQATEGTAKEVRAEAVETVSEPEHADPTPIKALFVAYADACFPDGEKRQRYADATAAILRSVNGSDMSKLSTSQVRTAVSIMEEEIAYATRDDEPDYEDVDGMETVGSF